MRIFGRTLLILAFAWLAYVLFLDAKLALHAVDQGGGSADWSRVIVLFLSIIAVAIAAGTLITLSVIPAFGAKVGGVFFNPDEQMHDPHAQAVAHVAQGDYAGAVAEYRRLIQVNPDDTMAISELARLYTERLHDPDAAATVLEDALDREWTPEQSAFLVSRLVDIYWDSQRDVERSRQLLQQIIDIMPGTSHAVNAQHRLKLIEHAAGQR
jgi:tetratricopeptide (TPR) repeat protein